MLPKELIIIGGGFSIQEGIFLGLKDKIKDKFVITCNCGCYHFDSTLTTCIDTKFYKGKLIGDIINREHINKLKSLSLIIATNRNEIKEIKYDNTILVPISNHYTHEPLKNGFYSHCLTGIFSLSLAAWLMNYNGIIFLLGMDWTKKTREEIQNKQSANTHYYNDIKHKGMGITKRYEQKNPDKIFKPFLNEKNLKIYNVNLDSNIQIFSKIDYNKMFELLNEEKYNQEELRIFIKNKF